MTAIQIPLILVVLFGIVTLLLYLVLVPEAGDHEPGNLSEEALRAHSYRDKLHTGEKVVFHERDQFAKALGSLSKSSNSLGGRLKILRDRNEIVGENLAEIRKGKEIDTFDRLLFPLKYLEKPEPWITSLKMFLKQHQKM